MLARVVLLLAAALLLTASPASADPEHDAFVTMSDAPDPVQAGDRITYTITVGSNGSGAANDVELEDRIPSGTTAVSATTSDPDADCNAVRPWTTVFRCDLGRIPQGQQVTVVLVVDTSPTTPSPITNVVTIEADDDSVARNNTATATTTVSPPPGADLVLTQSDSPDPVAAGGRLTYRFTVSNAGPAGARDVALVDDLPASTRRVSASSSQGGCAGSGVVLCALGAIQSRGVVTVTIVVAPTRNGSIVNGASVSAGAPSDPRTSNNTAFTTTRVVSPASPAPPPAAAAPVGAPASPITVGAAPDVIPPGKVQAVRAMVGSRSVVVRWRVPSDPDFERVELTRSSAGAGRRVVYRGKGKQFADRRLRNGVRYAYELRSFDRAGNASAGVRFAATPKALLLFSPLPNARVSAAPLLRWAAVRGSGFYNMQLYRGSKKVLTVWPRSNRFRLRARWTFRGRAERLAPGAYHWFVWPARGPRSRPRYGPLLGRSSFLVVRRAPSRPGGA